MGLVVRHSSPFMSPLVREFNLSCAKYTRPDSGNPHGLDSGPSPDVVQHFAGQSQYWRRLSHHPPAGVPAVIGLEKHAIYSLLDELFRIQERNVETRVLLIQDFTSPIAGLQSLNSPVDRRTGRRAVVCPALQARSSFPPDIWPAFLTCDSRLRRPEDGRAPALAHRCVARRAHLRLRMSGTPCASVATTGNWQAMASISATGRPS